MKDKIKDIIISVEMTTIEPEEAVNKLFDLFVVSQQRELLLAYHRYLKEELNLDLNEIWVDEHLKANNCG